MLYCTDALQVRCRNVRDGGDRARERRNWETEKKRGKRVERKIGIIDDLGASSRNV